MTLQPRGYQIELWEKAKEENIIICADTGSGKTLIAKMLIESTVKELSRTKRQSKWIIFLAPTVVLCEQQHRYLSENVSHSVGVYHGELFVDFWSIEKWRDEYSKTMVMVMTPQVFLDNLRHAIISIDQIALIVFDECHHAKKGHPYNRIMIEFYFDCDSPPKVLGLTASPIASGVKTCDTASKQYKLLQQLQQNLQARLVIPTQTVQAIHTARPRETIEYYPPPPDCFEQNPGIPEPTDPSKLFFSVVSLETTIESIGSWCAVYLIQDLLKKMQNFPYRQLLPFYEEHRRYLIEYHNRWNSLLRQPSPCHPHEVTPQVIILLEILSKHLEALKTNEKACVIIFVQTRYTCYSLTRLLNSLSLLLTNPMPQQRLSTCSRECQSYQLILQKSKILFSKHKIATGCLVSANTSRICEDMGSNANTLDRFRRGELQVLVATSVAEEGLDVQPCQLVIRFHEIQTLVSYVQSRGRARHQLAQYIVLEPEPMGSDEKKFTRIQKCEKLMQEAMQKLPELDDDFEVQDEDFYLVESTGARVSLNSAINLIYQYCSTLQSDRYSTSLPLYRLLIQEEDETEGFCCDLYLPPQSLVKGKISGTFHSKKILAKQSVSLAACKLLHEAGALDDNLRPVSLLSKNCPTQLKRPPKEYLLRTLSTNIQPWDTIPEDSYISFYAYLLQDSRQSPLPFILLSKFDLLMEPNQTLQFPMYMAIFPQVQISFLSKMDVSFDQLISLQQYFGDLCSGFLAPIHLNSLRDESAYISPLLIIPFDFSINSIDWNIVDQLSVKEDYWIGVWSKFKSHKFPQLLGEIERHLTLIFAQQTFGIQFNSLSILNTALTTPSTCLSYDYNRYETLGDAVLKFLVSLNLFQKHQNALEGQLSMLKDQMISNSELSRKGDDLHLSHFLLSDAFQVKKYIPPGYCPVYRDQLESSLRERISSNMVADVLEALLGGFYDDCNRNYMQTVDTAILLNLIDEVPSQTLPIIEYSLQENEKEIVECVEEILGYQFRQPGLVLEALTHPSFLLPAEIETHHHGDYQRLEFIGDAILSLVVTEYLFDWTPSLSSAEISEWRGCVVSNEFLGVATVRAGLHDYLRHNSPQLSLDISNFALALDTIESESEQNSQQLKSLFYSKGCSPKALADIFESLLAAIYFDSNGGLQDCRDVVFSLLLQPFVLSSLIQQEKQFCGVQKHPVSIIHEIAGGFGCRDLKTNFVEDKEKIQFHCQITCHGKNLSQATAKNKSQAKLMAALAISPHDLEVYLESNCICRNLL